MYAYLNFWQIIFNNFRHDHLAKKKNASKSLTSVWLELNSLKWFHESVTKPLNWNFDLLSIDMHHDCKITKKPKKGSSKFDSFTVFLLVKWLEFTHCFLEKMHCTLGALVVCWWCSAHWRCCASTAITVNLRHAIAHQLWI